MAEYTRVGVDTSKHVFTLHGIGAKGGAVLRRAGFVGFFRKVLPAQVAMEACGGSYHWVRESLGARGARELQALGHQVVLIPPQYVNTHASAPDRNLSC